MNDRKKIKDSIRRSVATSNLWTLGGEHIKSNEGALDSVTDDIYEQLVCEGVVTEPPIVEGWVNQYEEDAEQLTTSWLIYNTEEAADRARRNSPDLSFIRTVRVREAWAVSQQMSVMRWPSSPVFWIAKQPPWLFIPSMQPSYSFSMGRCNRLSG